MILTVDIGNTTIAFAAVKKLKVLDIKRVDTALSQKHLIKAMARACQEIKTGNNSLKAVVVSSVVPAKTKIVEEFVRKNLDLPCKIVGRDLAVPIKNRYKHPKQVGQDRLVGAYAALTLYGKPVIVIDLGTAITFDVVSASNEYLGGVIVPGIRLSAESLFQKTALLPKIDIQAPRSVIGKTTQDSILSGLFFGYGALCQGLIAQISKQLHAKPKVVMTGGHTNLMKKFIAPNIRIIDEHLVHKGMALLLND